MRSQVYRRHFSQNKRRVKEGKHLPVRSFHEYGAWEFEAAFKSKSEIYTWEKVWLTRWRGGSRLWRGRYWNVTEMGRQVSGPLKITNFYSSSVNIPWSSGISHKGRTEGLQQSSLFALLCCLLWKSFCSDNKLQVQAGSISFLFFWLFILANQDDCNPKQKGWLKGLVEAQSKKELKKDDSRRYRVGEERRPNNQVDC